MRTMCAVALIITLVGKPLAAQDLEASVGRFMMCVLNHVQYETLTGQKVPHWKTDYLKGAELSLPDPAEGAKSYDDLYAQFQKPEAKMFIAEVAAGESSEAAEWFRLIVSSEATAEDREEWQRTLCYLQKAKQQSTAEESEQQRAPNKRRPKSLAIDWQQAKALCAQIPAFNIGDCPKALSTPLIADCVAGFVAGVKGADGCEDWDACFPSVAADAIDSCMEEYR